jgi:hypothetical protein
VSYAPPAPSTAYAPAPPAAAPAYAAPAAPVAAYPPPAPAYPPPAPAAPAPVAVSRFGSPIPPDVLVEDPSYAALAFGTSGAASGAYGAPAGVHGHHGAAPAAAAGVPGTVKAAGIIGIVEGALSLGLGLLALLGYLALKSQIDQLASSPELAGSGLTAGSLLGLMLVGIVIVLLIGGGFLVAGIATLKGARWGAWALLVVSALGVLYGLYEMVTGDGGFGTLVSIGVSGAVVVLLVVKDSMAWLRTS